MPQEIEVWYVLPAIRKELAKALVASHGTTQKQAAELLGVTEAAISQYLTSKRGSDIVFDDKVRHEIDISAERIREDKQKLMTEMKRICRLSSIKLMVCAMHKGKDLNIDEYCCECGGRCNV
jgi:predicted transcriptional regulator